MFSHLSLDNLRGNLFGGLTAGVVALPLALAFGVASGAGPVAGLYGAIMVGFFASLFGGTPAQISGPTGPMTIVFASVFVQFSHAPAIAFTVVMLGGLFQIGFGVAKLGRYINLIPYPVVSGFMSGIGCILIIMQMDHMVGHPATSSIVDALKAGMVIFQQPNYDALAIGLVSLAICLFTPGRISRVVPSPLMALIVGTLMVLFGMDQAPVIGDIPTGFPSLHWPAFSSPLLGQMLFSGLVLAVLGSMDSLLTSVVADNATGTFHDSNKELIGQGVGNLASGLVGGIPGAGATIRTVSNIRAGGSSPVSGMVHAMLLLAVVLGLGQYAGKIPYAALAGVLIKVGLDVIDWPYLRRLRHSPLSGTALMLVVLTLTVLTNVITAVAAGMVMASLRFVKEMADLQLESIKHYNASTENSALTASEAQALQDCKGRVLLLHFTGPLTFGAANGVVRRAATLDPHEVLILDLSDVPSIDLSAAMALESIIRGSRSRNEEVILVGLNWRVARLFSQMKIIELVKETQRVDTRSGGLELAAQIINATALPGA
jgi:SulP family sulfate permease